MCLRVALIFQKNYSSPIILSRSGGQLKSTNCIISDRRIPLLAGIPICKAREFSRREYSMSRLCSIRHDIPVTLHTPRRLWSPLCESLTACSPDEWVRPQQWLHLLNNDVTAKVIVNGYFTNSLSIARGVRQGCFPWVPSYRSYV